MAETKRVIYYDQLSGNQPTNGDVIFVDNPNTGTHKMDLKSFVDAINNGFDSSIKSSGVSVSADNYSSIITNVNDQPVNSIYTYGAGLQSKVSNLPSNKAMTIINFAQKSTGGLGQVMLAAERNGSDDYLYFRTIGGSPATWSSWVKVANNADVEAVREALDNLDIETDKTLSVDGKAADAKAAGDAINDLKADLNDVYEEHLNTVPKVFSDMSEYGSSTGAGDCYISNRTIPSGYTVDNFYCYSGSSGTGYIYIIEKSTSKVLYRQSISVSSGANNIAVGYKCPSNCYFGVRGSKAYVANKGSNRETFGDYEFGTDGLYQPSTTTVNVGDILTINKTSSNVIIFSMSFTYSMPATGILADLADAVSSTEIITGVLNNGNLLRYKLIDDNVGYLGRWFDYNGKKCTNNDGAELFFKTKNTTQTEQIITISFGQITSQDVTPYYAYSIDGGDFVRKPINDNTIAVTAESAVTNEHIIRLVIDGMTESQGGGKYQGELGIYIDSITVNVGTIIGITPRCRVGMFLGDSITEGINALGTGANASVNSAVNAFPYFCCRELGAVSYRVGYGGTGMVVTGSFRSCQYALEYYYTGKHVEQFMVDFVVINHGINDYNNSVSTSDFKSAYENVINVLRAKFGNVPIFCVTPFNNAYDTQIQEVANEYDSCYYISSDGWNGETVDGTHLSANGARHNGELLADAIVPILGKSFFLN